MFVLSIGTFLFLFVCISIFLCLIGHILNETSFSAFAIFIFLLCLLGLVLISDEYPVGIDKEKTEIVVEDELDLLYDISNNKYIVILNDEEELNLITINLDKDQYDFLKEYDNDYILVKDFLYYWDFKLFKIKSYYNILFLNNDTYEEYQIKDEKRKLIMSFNE